MPTFRKKYLNTIQYESSNKINEFVDTEGGIIGGDRNVTDDSEIETGPIQKSFKDTSDYEKGISTTTDRAARYRQDIPWFATYSTGGSVHRVTERRRLSKKTIDEMIESLVKKSKDGEIIDKSSDKKVEKIIDILQDTEFDDSQIKCIKNALSSYKKISNG